jgi:hypothetical protein
LLDVVTKTPGAELAEIGEVFAKLSRFNAGGFGEGFAGYGADVVFLKALEAAEVNGQPVNRLARDFSSDWFLQLESRYEICRGASRKVCFCTV